MPSEPRWLDPEPVIEINRVEVAKTGEPHFLRDFGLLESALARPRHHWGYGQIDMALLAVSIIMGIARNHPFEQGNKRTGFIAGLSFLRINGYRLDPAMDGDMLAELIIAAVKDSLSENELAEALAKWIRGHSPADWLRDQGR